VAYTGVGINLKTNRPSEQKLRDAILTILSEPAFGPGPLRSRPSLPDMILPPKPLICSNSLPTPSSRSSGLGPKDRSPSKSESRTLGQLPIRYSILESAADNAETSILMRVNGVAAGSDSQSALDGSPFRTGLTQTLIELGE
jgi:hypothetical protein